MKEWTDEFMENSAECPVVEKYSDYENNQRSAYCYLRKVPMYYYQPKDIDASDRSGQPITGFREWDQSHAKRARCRGIFCR
jgi:hypothetical protein